MKSFPHPIYQCFIFVYTDEYKKNFSTTYQLGAMEFLCAVCAH